MINFATSNGYYYGNLPGFGGSQQNRFSPPGFQNPDPFSFFCPPPPRPQPGFGGGGFDFMKLLCLLLPLLNASKPNETSPPSRPHHPRPNPGPCPTPDPQTDADQTITNTISHRTINTAGGGDIITNEADDDIINTNGGNDIVILKTGRDNTVNSGAGDDRITLEGSQHKTQINAGDGADIVYLKKHPGSYSSTNNESVTLSGGAGSDIAELEGSVNDFKITTASNGDKVYTRKLSNSNDKAQVYTIKADVETVRYTDDAAAKQTAELIRTNADTVQLSGKQSEYKVSKNADGAKVYTHKTTGDKLTVGKDVKNTTWATADDKEVSDYKANIRIIGKEVYFNDDRYPYREGQLTRQNLENSVHPANAHFYKNHFGGGTYAFMGDLLNNFDVIDTNKNGSLDADEFEQVAITTGKYTKPQQPNNDPPGFTRPAQPIRFSFERSDFNKI
jgi:hypothetical protein